MGLFRASRQPRQLLLFRVKGAATMRYYANGKEISEQEFNTINDRNIKLFQEYDRTKNTAILLDMVFLTQIREEKAP